MVEAMIGLFVLLLEASSSSMAKSGERSSTLLE